MSEFTVRLLVSVLAAGCTVLLSGCEDKRDMTVIEAEKYIEELYGEDFSLDSRERLPGCHDNEYRKCYTFRDSSGIHCHVLFDIEHTDMGWHYRISEDYQTAYIIAHPELYQPLMNSAYYPETQWVQTSFRDRGGVVLYYDTYEDIAPVVGFAAEKLNEIPHISEKTPEQAASPVSIRSDTAKVYFVPRDGSFDPESPWYLPFALLPGESVNSDQVTAGLQSGSSYQQGVG